jgi:hypothetical protein
VRVRAGVAAVVAGAVRGAEIARGRMEGRRTVRFVVTTPSPPPAIIVRSSYFDASASPAR